MNAKNPFPPEPNTAPSARNPLLERSGSHARAAVVEIATGRAVRPSLAPTLPPAAVKAESAPPTPRPRVPTITIPRVIVDEATIRMLPLDAREGFVLSLIDGTSDLRTLVDVTGMNEMDVARIIQKLVELGVVEV